MEDDRIVELYWQRSENAVSETSVKYGKYCYAIAYRILFNAEDADESVNDTYLDAWNSMPPHRPAVLATFLGKLTRRIAIDRWRGRNAGKRGGGETALVLDELEECVSSGYSVEQEIEEWELKEKINAFLGRLAPDERDVFMARYFFMASVSEISGKFAFSSGKVKSMLFRTRNKLRAELEKEGLI